MAYEKVKIWDGTNDLKVNPDGSLTQPISFGTVGVTSVVVGISSIPVLDASTTRKMAMFTNDSGNNIYLNYTGLSSGLHIGDVLTPYGYRLFDSWVPSAVRAIATGLSSILLVNFA